jgi:hypothetical protein
MKMDRLIIKMRKTKLIFVGIGFLFCSFFKDQLHSQIPSNSNFEIIDQEVTIQFDGSSTLKGFLTRRSDIKSGPPILLVNGQQFADANLNNTGSPIYKDIARYLAENGYIVLRMHSRAWIDNTIIPSEISIEELKQDVRFSFNWLNRHKMTSISKVGLVAYGENMLAALDLCNLDESVSYIIGIQSLSIPIVEHICKQTTQVLTSSQLPDSSLVKYIDLLHLLLKVVQLEDDVESCQRQMQQVMDNHLQYFSRNEIEQLALSKRERVHLLSHLNSVFIRSYLKQQTNVAYMGCTKPQMNIFGAKSDEYWLHTSLMHLDKLKSKLGQDLLKIYVMENHNEILSENLSGVNISITRKGVISKSALNLMLDFIKIHLN